jgi:receptor tyrosine kinase-like orphan receptor 1
MGNMSVFISPELTMEKLERKLAAAAGVMKTSPDISSLCSRFVWYSLCATVLPLCRTPEETNHIFFLNKNKFKGLTPSIPNKPKKSNPPKSKKQPKSKTNGIKIVPTDVPIYEIPTTTSRPRTIDYYSKSNSYYEETDGKRRRRRDIDIHSVRNG